MRATCAGLTLLSRATICKFGILLVHEESASLEPCDLSTGAEQLQQQRSLVITIAEARPVCNMALNFSERAAKRRSLVCGSVRGWLP
jgi:hypothetical protein